MTKRGIGVLVAVLALAGPAQGAVSSFPASTYAIGAPVLAGPGTAWTEPFYSGYVVKVRRQGANSTVRRVRSRYDRSASLAGSPDGLLIREQTVAAGFHGMPDELIASATFAQVAPTAGFVRRGPGCIFPEVRYCARSTAIDGPNAVLPDASAVPNRAQVVSLRGLAPPVVVDQVGSPVAIAGSKLAWVAPSRKEILVYDWRLRQTMYRVPYPPDGEPGSDHGFTDVAVQSDGATVYGYDVKMSGHAGGTQLGWSSPTSPEPHRSLVRPQSWLQGLAVRDGQVLFTRQRRNDYGEPFEAYRGSLGGPARPMVRGVTNPAVSDGRRLAWSERTCSGTRVAMTSLEDVPAGGLDRTPRCPLRLTGPLRVDRKGNVAIRPRCAGLPRRCVGYLRGVRTPLGTPAFRDNTSRELAGGGVSYALTRTALRQVRRRHRLSVHLRLVFGDDVVRSGDFVIRAGRS